MATQAKYTKQIQEAIFLSLKLIEEKLSHLEKRIELLEKEKNE